MTEIELLREVIRRQVEISEAMAINTWVGVLGRCLEVVIGMLVGYGTVCLHKLCKKET